MRSFEYQEYHSDIPQFKLGHIQSHNMFRPIVQEWKYLMDYNALHLLVSLQKYAAVCVIHGNTHYVGYLDSW